MPFTRAQTKSIFKYLVENVVPFEDTEPGYLALEAETVTTLTQLLSLDPVDVLSWTYPSTDAAGNITIKPLPKGQSYILKHLVNFTKIHWSSDASAQDKEDVWLSLNNGHFMSYMATPTTPPIITPTVAPTSTSDAAMFHKGNKRDISVYPVLKDILSFSTWKLKFTAIATKDGLARILEPSYIPGTDAEKHLFSAQQQFLFAVFTQTLVDPTAKDILRRHQGTTDAQKIYSELVSAATSSARATLAKQEILKFLTSVKLDHSWKGTHDGFILHWCSQLRQFEEICHPSELYNSFQKFTMLSLAVSDIPYLKQVESFNELLNVTGHSSADYTTYLALLRATAQREDDKRTKSFDPKRRLNQHLFTYDYVDQGGDLFRDAWNEQEQETEFFDSDFEQTIQLLNQTSISKSTDRPQIPKDLWDQLPQDAKLWYIRKDLKDKDNNKGTFKPRSNPPSSTHRAISQHDSMPAPEQRQLVLHQNQSEIERLLNSHSLTNIQPSTSTETQSQEAQQIEENTLAPHDIRRILSAQRSTSNTASTNVQGSETEDRVIQGSDGKMYLRLNLHYRISSMKRKNEDSLIDRGANGGFAGSDVRVLEIADPHQTVDVHGIEDHTVKNLKLGTVAGLVQTQRGSVVCIMHQYAIYGKGKTIHSSPQLEHFGNLVDDKSRKVGGKQRITTLEGYVIPLQFCQGLAYLPMTPPTDKDLDELPHVILTSDGKWDPSILDNEFDLTNLDDELDELPKENVYGDIRFDPTGNYRGVYNSHCKPSSQVKVKLLNSKDKLQTSSEVKDKLFYSKDKLLHSKDKLCHSKDKDIGYLHSKDKNFHSNNTICSEYGEHNDLSSIIDMDLEDYVESCIKNVRLAHRLDWKTSTPDAEALQPYLLWQPPEVITHTLAATTQWGRHVPHETYKKAYKSVFPAANVRRRNEAVATDTFFSDTPAIDDGATCAQFYVGLDSLHTSVYGMKSEKEFPSTLQDTIRKHGAMDKLISDCAQVEISNKVLDILRNLFISDWQSKPYNQHQNPAERRYQDVKRATNILLDRTGAPAYTWLLAITYVCFILNVSSNEALGWKTPHQVLFGQTPDISELFQFEFWEPVYFATGEQLDSTSKPSFPSSSHEKSGRFVGFSDTVGDKFCYKILTDDTQQIIHRSAVRSARNTNKVNRRLTPHVGEPDHLKEIIKSPHRTEIGGKDTSDGETPTHKQVFGKVFDPDELIGRTYLMDKEENGERFRAKIVSKIIEQHENAQQGLKDLGKIKFLVNIENQPDQIVDYNTVIDHITSQLEDEQSPEEVYYKFKAIVGHQGPLQSSHPDYKNSSYNVMVEWEDGSKTYEPLTQMIADDPVTCALYAKEQGLLDKPGWKRLKGIARRDKKMIRMLNQSRLRSFRRAPI